MFEIIRDPFVALHLLLFAMLLGVLLLIQPAPARCEYGCAGQVCGKGMGCNFPCACFDNGTGPGVCVGG